MRDGKEGRLYWCNGVDLTSTIDRPHVASRVVIGARKQRTTTPHAFFASDERWTFQYCMDLGTHAKCIEFNGYIYIYPYHAWSIDHDQRGEIPLKKGRKRKIKLINFGTREQSRRRSCLQCASMGV